MSGPPPRPARSVSRSSPTVKACVPSPINVSDLAKRPYSCQIKPGGGGGVRGAAGRGGRGNLIGLSRGGRGRGMPQRQRGGRPQSTKLFPSKPPPMPSPSDKSKNNDSLSIHPKEEKQKSAPAVPARKKPPKPPPRAPKPISIIVNEEANVRGRDRSPSVTNVICLDQSAFIQQIQAEQKNKPKKAVPISRAVKEKEKKYILADKKSQHFVESFIANEFTYMGRLESIVEGILSPIREKNILNPFQIVSLFSSLESIIELTNDIIQSLDNTFTVVPGLTDAEVWASLADVFVNNSKRLEHYINYISNLSSLSDRIGALEDENMEFKTLISTWEQGDKHNLKDIMFEPKTRIGVYCSFVEFLLEQVPDDCIETCNTEIHTDDPLSVTVWGDTKAPSLQQWPSLSLSLSVSQVACGGCFYGCLMNDSSVYVWGTSPKGALGLGDLQSVNVPTKVKSYENIREISCGREVMGAVTKNGELYLSGLLPNGSSVHTPQIQAFEHKGITLAIHFAETFAIITREDPQFGASIYSWGEGKMGQLGLGVETTVTSSPMLIEMLSGFDVRKIGVSDTNVMGVTSANTLYVWGSNKNQANGTQSSDDFFFSPEPVLLDVEYDSIESPCCGKEIFYFIGDGSVVAWGLLDEENPVFAPTFNAMLSSLSLSTIHCGGNTFVATSSDRAFIWGVNTTAASNQLLDTPVPVPTLQKKVEILQMDCCSSQGIALHYKAPKESERSRILSAIDSTNELQKVLNEQILRVENISKLLEIDILMTNSKDYAIVNQTREFIMKTTTKVKVNENDGACFMFDDSILLCKKDRKNTFEIVAMVPFSCCMLGNAGTGGHSKPSFEIRELTSTGTSTKLGFANKGEKDLWYARIMQQMEEAPPAEVDPTPAPVPDSPAPLDGPTRAAPSDRERPPSYLPPAPPQGETVTTINLSDVQANWKSKTKKLKPKLPRFSRGFGKLGSRTNLTTEGTSEPARTTLPTYSQVKEPTQLPLPTIPFPLKQASMPILCNSPVLPPKPSQPEQTSENTKILPMPPPVVPSAKILTNIRELLALGPEDDIFMKVKEMAEELAWYKSQECEETK